MHLKRFFTLAICLMSGILLPLSTSSAAMEVNESNVVELFGKDYIRYEVKKQETIFSICRRFQVLEEELLAINPFLSEGLKKGQTILIPIRQQANKSDTTASKPATELKAKQMESNTTMTVLLPFEVTTQAGANDRYVEFYQGLLLAADTLKSLGLSFTIQTHSVGEGTSRIQELIDSGVLNRSDYVVGGTHPDQIRLLSAWAMLNQKNVVLPFSSRIPEMDSNPWLFQTNTTHAHMYERLSEEFIRQYSGYNIILLKASTNNPSADQTFTSHLRKKFTQKGLSYVDVLENEDLSRVEAALHEDVPNLVVPYQMSMSETIRFVATINSMANNPLATTTKKIQLFGYPEWQALPKRQLQYLYDLNTLIFSNFYADFQRFDLRAFQLNYTKQFGRDMLNTFPKYAMMGYDIANWFIPRMIFERGQNAYFKGPKYLQQVFHFKSLQSGGGAFNQSFFLIQYKQDLRVEVSELR